MNRPEGSGSKLRDSERIVGNLTLPAYGRFARDTASELPRRADSRNQSLRNGSKNSQESELLQFAGHFEESDFERVRF
jgi:hypothetical protein